MTETKQRTVKFFKTQFEAFNFTTQFGAAVAGVQSGKTFLGAHWAGKKMIEFPKGTGVIVAPTYGILRQATIKKLFDIFPELRAYFKEQKGEIVLPTGGIVYVRSADRPLGIEGISADWIWLDEGGQCSLLTWTVCRSRVSMTGGQILITTTPYNMGWLYTDFFVPWRDNTDKNFSFYTWKSIENPHYPKEFYEAEEKRLSPEEFARRYQGEFRKMTGLVWDLPEEAIIQPIENLAPKSEVRIMGVDWGFRNPAAIIVGYLYDNEWYLVDEWKEPERTTAEIIQVIENKIKEHKIQRVYADPAEPDRLQECRNARIPIYEANKDVKGGISNVRTLINERRFKVFNTCKETIDEMSMYHYPEPKIDEQKEEKEEPEKFNDHLCFTKDTIIEIPIGKPLSTTYTGKQDVYEFMGSRVTANHPYLTQRGFVRLDSLRYCDRIVIWKNKLLMELSLDDTQTRNAVSLRTISYLLRRNVSAIKQNAYTGIYGKNIMAKYLKVLTYTTSTAIHLITSYLISNLFQMVSTSGNIMKRIFRYGEKTLNMQGSLRQGGMDQRTGSNSIDGLEENRGRIKNNQLKHVNNVGRNIKHSSQADQNSATIIAKLKHCGKEDVYSTTTTNGFFVANGIVVSNCDALRYMIHSYQPIKADYKQTTPILPYYPSLGI